MPRSTGTPVGLSTERILEDQEVTPFWGSVHRISGYQGYQPDIRGIINGYQEEIDQIVKYLTDSRISKIFAGYTKIARYQLTVVRE